MAYGMDAELGFCWQNSGDVSQVDSLVTLPFITEDFEFTPEDIPEQNMYGYYDAAPDQAGPHRIRGSINMESHPMAIGFLFKSVLGQVATTSGAGIQTHIFDPIQADWDERFAGPPASVEINRGGNVSSSGLYYGCVGNALTLEMAEGQLMKVTGEFVGVGFSRKAAYTPVFPVGANPFIWDQSSLSMNGVAIHDFRSLSVKVTNNVEPRWTLRTGKEAYRVVRTERRMIELSGTVEFAQNSMWEWLENRSEIPFVGHFASAQAPHALTIDAPKVRLKTYNPQVNGAGRLEVSFTGEVKYSTDSANALRLTLVNTQAWY